MKVISFTGGLGAQIVSAAAYFYLKDNDTESPGAYMGYFATPLRLATPGVENEVSHWQWDLHHYGIEMNDFFQPVVTTANEVIWDGPEKGNIAFQGLNQVAVKNRFPVGADVFEHKKKMFGDESFACMHIRRGDYLNVAAYAVINDATFHRIASRISRLVRNLLVVSDSPLSSMMIENLKKLPINTRVAIGGAPSVIHGLMRISDVLICSNSQFSLTAAILRDEFSLTFYPSQHDNDPNSYSNNFLSQIREFQVFTKL